MLIVKLVLLLAFVAAALPVLAHIVHRWYALDRRADVVHHVPTKDGWRLALHEYRPDPAAPKRDYPVLCCHGLSGNRLGFDFDDDLSIARHLTRRGHHVFLLDLRGAGESDAPAAHDVRRFDWDLDTHVYQDAPAAVDAALRVSGAGKLHWIGHSMGGMVGYGALQTGDAERFASITLVGSPGEFGHAKSVAKFRPVLDHFKLIYMKQITRIGALWIEYLRFLQRWSGNESLREGDRALSFANLQSNTPTTLMSQLAGFALDDTVRLRSGVDLLEGLGRFQTPVMALAGENDVAVPPSSVRRVLDAFGSERKEFHVLGPSHGAKDPYGHLTLLIGKDAAAEVYPLLSAWLEDGYRVSAKAKPKAPVKKAAVKKTAAKKPAVKTAPVKKTTAKKPAEKTASPKTGRKAARPREDKAVAHAVSVAKKTGVKPASGARRTGRTAPKPTTARARKPKFTA